MSGLLDMSVAEAAEYGAASGDSGPGVSGSMRVGAHMRMGAGAGGAGGACRVGAGAGGAVGAHRTLGAAASHKSAPALGKGFDAICACAAAVEAGSTSVSTSVSQSMR